MLVLCFDEFKNVNNIYISNESLSKSRSQLFCPTTQDVESNAMNNQSTATQRWDELERLCINSTLYTSLLNIYRMSFISGHDEEVTQHFANLYQALIFDSFTEVQAQNMRQALFNENYFIVRERNEYSRLPRYDLPKALYSFIEGPPLIIENNNNRKRIRSKQNNNNKANKNKPVHNIHTLLRKDCLDSISYSNILHEMTKDILRDPFGVASDEIVPKLSDPDANPFLQTRPTDFDFIQHSIPIISMQPITKKTNSMDIDNEDSENDSSKGRKLKPLPKCDVFEIVEIDTFEVISDCYTEIIENEYKEEGMVSIPLIETEEDAIKFMERYNKNKEKKATKNGYLRYYGSDKYKFYDRLNEKEYDELLCDIILDILCESYNNQNISFGMGLNKKLFEHKNILSYFGDVFGCKRLNVNHWNYTLHHIRYLINTFEVLCVNEFTEIKLMPTKLLRDNPSLSYFCIFPYTHDPNEWKKDKEEAAKKKKVGGLVTRMRHGITFDRDFEACYMCNPWIRNGDDKKPFIDNVMVSNLKDAVLSIIFNYPGIDLFSLYYNHVIKYILTPQQLFKMCLLLRDEMRINVVQSIKALKIKEGKGENAQTKIQYHDDYRFFAVL